MWLPPVVTDPPVQAAERAQDGRRESEWLPRAHAVQRLVRMEFAHTGQVEEQQARAPLTGRRVMFESDSDELVLNISDFAEEDAGAELEPDHESQVRPA